MAIIIIIPDLKFKDRNAFDLCPIIFWLVSVKFLIAQKFDIWNYFCHMYIHFSHYNFNNYRGKCKLQMYSFKCMFVTVMLCLWHASLWAM